MCAMQGYGFVEFSKPSEAQKCKEAMEKIEMDMRPDVRRRQSAASGNNDEADGKGVDGKVGSMCPRIESQ